MPNFSPTPRRGLRLRIAAAVALLSLMSSALAAERPYVVATTGPLGDVAAAVAGDCLTVTVLMGPGVDPHLYRASARDVQALQRAHLVLYHGFGLEGQLAQVLGRLGARIGTLAVAEVAIPPEALLHEEPGVIDPHVWMDASLWALVPPLLAERFSTLAPACADALAERAERLAALFASLDAWVAAAIATIPDDARVLVTGHDAFSYLGRRYGLEVVAIQGISTEAEPSVRDVRETADLVHRRGVPAVFFETSLSPRSVEAVIAAARDRGATVTVGGTLFGDALGAAGTSAGTYPGMIVHTVAAIATGLGGEVPAWSGALAEWAGAWGDLPAVTESAP